MRWRRLGAFSIYGLAAYGLLHLASTALFAVRALPRAIPVRSAAAASLSRSQQPLVSALTRVLTEDGVADAERWATAIVRASPSEDLGYLALVTAQIRRESHFLAPDLEWLYQRLVPDLVHELGVADPLRTIGPMQVQRWRLQDHFEQALGRRLDAHTVKELAVDIEQGVAACVAVLDRLVTAHVPDRRLRGWIDSVGPAGCAADQPVLARDWLGVLPPERTAEALRQKLLGDLTAEPLALDGVRGARTEQLLAARPDLAGAGLRSAWQQRFGVDAPLRLAPRIAHDASVAFVLADFHAGTGACRTAALQALLVDLFGVELVADGKWGPRTRAAAVPLIAAVFPDDEDLRTGLFELLLSGHKNVWLRDQLLRHARRLFRERRGVEAPQALVPDLWFDSASQAVKGLGRISVEGYVAGSVAFYEDYLRRLALCTGREVPSATQPGG